MPAKSLHIAWIGFVPAETGGVPGVATDLLEGLAKLGHTVDCFFPAQERQLPKRFAGLENLDFIWGTSGWRWNRWYSKTKITAFASGLIWRGFASLRLRKEVARRHRQNPYDVIYQFSNIENLAMPSSLRHTVPLVSHPETHTAGELKFLVSERRLSYRCQPRYIFALAATVLWLRMRVQRSSIRSARLLVCISSVFRDHLVSDYGFPRESTVVVPNPVRLARFPERSAAARSPLTVLVLGRIAVRKGVEDVIALAKLAAERGLDVRFRLVGGPSLWSDYTKLLQDLPSENAEYVGRLHPSAIPDELAGSDILLQASKYEPFGLTVAEALAAGVPVVATTEVGAIEGVDPAVVAAVEPGDVEGMASAIAQMRDRLNGDRGQLSRLARAEAERLFAPEVVCRQISSALEQLVDGARG